MKYKNIDAALHNFGHSFVSLMNTTNDSPPQYVVDILREVAFFQPTRDVRLQFGEGGFILLVSVPHRHLRAIEESMHAYSAWLPRHLKNHGIDHLFFLQLRYSPDEAFQVLVSATDTRGQRHEVLVKA